jgi:hypothetical protein
MAAACACMTGAGAAAGRQSSNPGKEAESPAYELTAH